MCVCVYSDSHASAGTSRSDSEGREGYSVARIPTEDKTGVVKVTSATEESNSIGADSSGNGQENGASLETKDASTNSFKITSGSS